MAFFLDPASVHRTVLPNGLTLLVRRDASAPVVAIVTHVKAGYFDETDDVSGIAHVLEHMFFKGTPSRGVGEIARETKASGGYLNAHTTYDGTRYYAVVPSSGFTTALAVQADAYANSVIDAGELEREIEVIIEEARRKTDNPHAVSTEKLYELLHDSHRMRRWRIGHEAGLRTFTRDALTGFYRNFYKPSSTILSIVGDVDPARTLELVVENYGSLTDGRVVRSPGPAEPHHEDTRYRELAGDVTQSQLVIGWRTPHTLHEDTPALDFAAAILGAGRASRLYRAVRERQLAASVSATNFTLNELGVLTIHAEMTAELALDAARAVWDQLRVLREEPIQPVEMDRVRAGFEAQWVRRLESMEGQANHLADWESLGDWRLGDEYYSRFLSLEPGAVHDVARRHLAPEAAGVLLYRPEASRVVASDAGEMFALLGSTTSPPLEPLPPLSVPQMPAAAGTPALEQVESGISVFRTQDELPILVRPRAGTPIVHIGLQGLGGVRDETPVHAGVTALAMRASIKGTATRTATQIAQESGMLGATIAPFFRAESFGWMLSVPAQHVEAAAALLADVVTGATIPEDALEAERAATVSDLAALRDDMHAYPVRLALSRAYEGHPYALTPFGSDETLAALTAEDVRQWYRGMLLGSPIAVGIVGDVDPGDAAQLLAAAFGGLRAAPSREVVTPGWPDTVREASVAREKAQTALAMAFPGPSRRDDRRHAARLLATIASGLGGRFFEELRDRQSLAYTVFVSLADYQLSGAFLGYIGTSPAKEERARRGLIAEFQRLRDELVTEEELTRSKRYTIGSRAISRQSGATLLAEMLEAWILGSGLAEITSVDARIEAVTAEEIREVARECFDAGRRVEGVVRGVEKSV